MAIGGYMTGDEPDPIAEAAYDQLAASYDEEVASSPYAVDLAVPGTTALVPDPGGKRILDAGCGTGSYTEWLTDAGATVIGLDVSAAMLARARDRVGGRAGLVRADLGRPLGFDTAAFDGVVSLLAMGYVADWSATVREFARVLRPGGFLVLTVNHPFDEFPLAEDENYFAVERRSKRWAVEVPYYRRPLSAMLEPLLSAGFSLEAVGEPQPTATFREKWPERYERETRMPVFLCLRAVLPA